MLFIPKKKNKRIGNAKPVVNETRIPRKNRFKRNIRINNARRKIESPLLAYFLGGILTVSLISTMLIFIHDFFTQTHYFGIRHVDITGIKHLTQKDIMTQAGVLKGDNLLSINLGKIQNKLLAHPWIKAARVSRDIPDSLMINVAEYAPLAITKIENEKYLLCSEGFLFKKVSDSDPKELPVITGISFTDIPIGDLAASNQFNAVQQVLDLGRTSNALIPIAKIRQIKMDRELGLILDAFEPSISIQIGYGDYQEKYQNLRRIIKYLQNEDEKIQASAIDLRDLDQIVVTPVTMESPRQG